MGRENITVSIKGDIKDLEKKISTSKEIINKAQTDIIQSNNRLKASQEDLNKVQNTYKKEIQDAQKEIKRYVQIKAENGKLTKEQNTELAKARASLSLYKTETKKLVDVEKEKTTEIKKSIAAQKELQSIQRASISDNRLEVDAKRKIIKMEDEVAKSKDKSTVATSNLANATIRYLRWAGTIAGVVYAGKRAWDATIGSGIEVNKIIESNTYGIAALTSANTRMIDSLGNTLTPLQKFQLGQESAKNVIQDLRKEAVKTYATFPQLIEIFQQATGQTLSMGNAFGTTIDEINSNTIKLASRMSNIAGAIGMPMDRVREEIRSLLSANASTDSLIATMIFGSPSEANKAIQNAKKTTNGLSDLLDNILKPFDVLADTQSFQKSVLEIQNSWQTAMGDMVAKSGVFKDITESFYSMSKDITDNTDGIVEGFDTLYHTLGDIGSVLKYIVVPAAVIGSVSALSAVSTVLTASVVALTTAIRLNPILATVSAGVAGIYAVSSAVSDLIDNVEELQNKAKAEQQTSGFIKKGLQTDLVALQEQKKAVQTSIDMWTKYNVPQEQILKKKEEMLTIDTKIATANQKIADIDASDNAQKNAELKLETIKKSSKLIATIGINQESIKEQEKLIAKSKKETFEIDKKRLEFIEELKQNEIKLAIEKSKQKQDTKAIALLESVISTNRKAILASEKIISEEKNRQNKKESERNKKLAEQEAIRKKIAWFESGSLNEEKIKISLQEMKIKGLETEYEKLKTKEHKEKTLLEIYEQKAKLSKMISSEEEKQSKLKLKTTIASFDRTNTPEELGKIYTQLKVEYKDDDIKLSEIEKWYDKLYKKISKNPLIIDVKLEGFDEVSNNIATIGNSFQDITKASNQYSLIQKNIKSTEIEKKQASIDYAKTTISGYADMTGAIAGFYSADSNERKKLQEVQKAMHIAEMAMMLSELNIKGTLAILTQGQGDPYTAFARMAMMASIVASLGVVVGGAFSSSKVSTDAFSSMAENTGTGSVLGDTSKQSESIANSMSILEDFAQPQYSTLSQMNKYLASIDQKMGGISSIIYQNAGFAVGEGFTGSSKQNLSVNSTLGGIGGGAGFLAGAGAMSAFGATGALSVLGPAGLVATAVDQLLLGGALTDILGGVVNKVLGGLFGKTSKSLSDAGIYFGEQLITSAIDEIEGSAYQTITTTKKSWFSKSSSTSSYFQSLDEETARQFSLVLDSLYNTVVASGVALDTQTSQIESELEDFVVNIGKISLKDKTATEIQEQITAVFGQIGDNLAKEAFPLLVSFQQVGEGMFETLTRVSIGMEEAGYYISRLGSAFADLSYTDILNTQGNVGFEALLQSIVKTDEAVYGLDNNLVNIIENLNATAEELYITYDALDGLRGRIKFLAQDIVGLSSSMIYGAGSLDELQSGFESYFENFLSESEQLSYQISEMQKEFIKINVAMPTSKEGFSSLLDSIDLTTESGQELYGRLITLSDAFASMSDNVDDSISSLQGALDQQLSSYKDIINGVRGISDTFISSIATISSTIDTLLGKKTGADTTQSQIEAYWNKRGQAESLIAKGADITSSESEKLKTLASELGGLSTSLQSTYADNTIITDNLVEDLSNINAQLTFSDKILNVSIVDGLGTLLGLNEQQLSQLQTAAEDGKFTNDELSNITNLSKIQKDGIIEFANNSKYFSTEGTLSNLEEYSRLQLETYQRTLAEESVGLSKSTLTYGDYIGKQEQIDIAKLLGVSYESAQPLIEQLQGISNLSGTQQLAAVQQMIGYTAGSTSYDTAKASQISALSPYLSNGISGAVGGVESSVAGNIEAAKIAAEFAKEKAEFTSRYNDASALFSKEKQESDIAKKDYSTVPYTYLRAGYKIPQEENIASNQPLYRGVNGKDVFMYPIAWQIQYANTQAKYRTEFAQAEKAYKNLQALESEKIQKGYSGGGYTGDGSKFDIAGFVHKREHVVPMEKLNAIGGSVQLESMINREISHRNSGNSSEKVGTNNKNSIIEELQKGQAILSNGLGAAVRLLDDLMSFHEERRAEGYKTTVNGTVTAIAG